MQWSTAASGGVAAGCGGAPSLGLRLGGGTSNAIGHPFEAEPTLADLLLTIRGAQKGCAEKTGPIKAKPTPPRKLLKPA